MAEPTAEIRRHTDTAAAANTVIQEAQYTKTHTAMRTVPNAVKDTTAHTAERVMILMIAETFIITEIIMQENTIISAASEEAHITV